MTTGSNHQRQDHEHDPATPVAPPGGVPAPMTLDQIAAVQPDRRRQLNVAVPEELLLHRRTAMYREDHGMHATRQNVVALAVDEWLRSRGY
ncbi:hypothetical protein ABZ799_28815 [Nocardiopsis dassonvillei]|uniref:hypothetical protein n=1 Tax=Nocardiopsis dassonvillei TaxID=2014 RepID=UPI0033E370EF